MALTPITFKADLGDNNSKGHIRPEDLAAMFAFLNTSEAGVLQITGTDCQQFGAINIVGNTAQVTFHKGYVIVQGRAIYIDEGTEVAFTLPTSGTVNGVLGIKINLAEDGSNEVTWFQKLDGVVKNDLLKDTMAGVYEFVLYNYTATSTSFTLGSFTGEIILKFTEFLNQYMQGNNFVTQPRGDNSNKLATTAFVNNFLQGGKLKQLTPGADIHLYISKQSTTDMKDAADEKSDRLANCYQIEIMPGVQIITGIVNNPSGYDKNRWYKLYLGAKASNSFPQGFVAKNKYVFASFDSGSNGVFDVDYVGTLQLEVGVYSKYNNPAVGIFRNTQKDVPNMIFTILMIG